MQGQDVDPFDLERFIAAQEKVYQNVVAELQHGRKKSHWMWFIFPQVDGLGHSSTARFYAIKNLQEARAYLCHPLLGPRLYECVSLLLQLTNRSAETIFGYPDTWKLRSSMTLFAVAAGDDSSPFQKVLDHYYHGERDQASLDLFVTP